MVPHDVTIRWPFLIETALGAYAAMDYRIGIGEFWHESNSFSSLLTTVDDFQSYGGILIGDQILNRQPCQDEIAGFIDTLSRNREAEIVPLISAGALPSGCITQEALGVLEEELRAILRKAGPLHGICFALHGAISAETIPDIDGYFLRVMREEQSEDIPIMVALDCHAVVTRQMVNLATALIGYRTHPHIDRVETGARAATILLDTLRGRIRPVTRHQKIPLLLPPPDDGTNSGALKDLFEEFIAWDRLDGVIACSLCPSFAWQDVPEQGWSALAVTDNDPELGDRLNQRLAQSCWDARSELLPQPMVDPETAIRQARSITGNPVIIIDSADTVGGGAPGDTTDLLDAMLTLRGQVDGMLLIHLPDPQAVQAAKVAGPGQHAAITVGGKRDTRFSRPVNVTGQVLSVTDGPISDDGQFGSEPMIDVGSIACIGVNNVRIVVTDKPILGPQPSVFRKVNIEPFEAKIVGLKTGVGYKVTYGDVAKAVIRADCPGAVSYNLANFNFRHIPRPMFPIDEQEAGFGS